MLSALKRAEMNDPLSCGLARKELVICFDLPLWLKTATGCHGDEM
jgi:hypothetical protein